MSANRAPPRDDYHHGNLVEAALAEGLKVLERGGDLSMRAIARSVGVAHRALFNHFQDRATFEAALAARGFDSLARALDGAIHPADFVRIYGSFALANAGMYDLMMGQSYAAFDAQPDLRRAADAVISVSLGTLATGIEDREDARRAVLRIWMLAHGGVSLHRSGVLRQRTQAEFLDELLIIAGFGPAAWEGLPRTDCPANPAGDGKDDAKSL
jgi:AcrR family transcriptional regulator